MEDMKISDAAKSSPVASDAGPNKSISVNGTLIII